MSGIRASGGVLWRPAGDGVEVALVHRPRYDDWSLPKGKLEPDEHPLAAAVREVREETGQEVVVGRRLGTSRYDVLEDGRIVPKSVRWWAMRALGGAWEPDAEVDALAWLSPEDAEERLTAGRDLAPLRLLLSSGLATSTVVLVRHGSAGSRAAYSGDDLDRPLDAKGRAQAAALGELLRAYGPTRVLSAPAARCVATVQPLAERLGVPVEADEAFGEAAHAKDPGTAADALAELVPPARGCVVVCSQGPVIPAVLAALGRTGDLRTKKGAFWALSFDGERLVDADHSRAPG